MKKIILILFLLAGSACLANAQISKKSAEQRAAHQTKKLQKQLNLTADQAGKVNTILYNQATRMDSLKANPSIDKRTDQLTRKTIVLTTASKMSEVLNPDQQQAYQKLMEMRKQKHKSQRQNMPAAVAPPVQG